ncbi:hypothetical protein [Aureimonas leprariae]|uniref:Uncharacterized protein n=1 Tax=Plantimonas leprariae TaxID=2615207 RepID=A0A7V7PKC6_9HYPH|nr:hypothetical protein [Aureimonas leprariae]KAB0676209.1 hypothetical protein F6X38_21965 [Aureimonas leprariae]
MASIDFGHDKARLLLSRQSADADAYFQDRVDAPFRQVGPGAGTALEKTEEERPRARVRRRFVVDAYDMLPNLKVHCADPPERAASPTLSISLLACGSAGPRLPAAVADAPDNELSDGDEDETDGKSISNLQVKESAGTSSRRTVLSQVDRLRRASRSRSFMAMTTSLND